MKLAILKVEAHNLLRYYNAESFNFTEGGGGGGVCICPSFLIVDCRAAKQLSKLM